MYYWTFQTEERTECVWYIIENNSKKSETVVSTRTSVPKITELYPFLIDCSGVFGEKINIGTTSENIKCVNLRKIRVNYYNEEKSITI